MGVILNGTLEIGLLSIAQDGLLEKQQQMNPQMAQMGQRPGGNMPMPTVQDAARQGLLQ